MDRFTLKAIRINSGKTQEECAEYLGMSIRTFKQREKENYFNMEDGFKLAYFCGINDLSVIDYRRKR